MGISPIFNPSKVRQEATSREENRHQIAALSSQPNGSGDSCATVLTYSASSLSQIMDYDRILQNIGTFGRIQKLHYILICWPNVCAAYYILSLGFIGQSPGYTCKDRPSHDPCQLQPPCDLFVYGEAFTSIVTEWDLICENKKYVDYAQSFVMIGFLFGNLVMGSICDMIGRKKTLIGGSIMLIAVQTIAAFTTSYRQFLITRVITGFLCGNVASAVLILETTHKSWRATLSNLASTYFSFSIVILAATAYVIRDWRTFLIVSNLAILPFCVFCWWLPESPPWLVTKGRITEAEDTLLDIALKNGISVPRSMVSMVSMGDTKSSTDKAQKTNILNAFKTPVLRRRMFILIFIWPVTCMSYYGLTLLASGLGGNMYINMAASGLVEIPGVFIAIYACNRFGRRKTVSCGLLLGSVTCFGVILAPGNTDAHSGSSNFQFALAMTGKMSVAAVFAVMYTYTGELMPTVIRSSGIGMCAMTARVGGIIAPLLSTLGDGVSYITFGITCLVASVIILSLPETMNTTMPESIDDVEATVSKTPVEYHPVSHRR